MGTEQPTTTSVSQGWDEDEVYRIDCANDYDRLAATGGLIETG